jgi:hypothetical protein
MKRYSERTVEKGVYQTGHDGVISDYLRARAETEASARLAISVIPARTYTKPRWGLVPVGAIVLAAVYVTTAYLIR